jgi:hypothetical protein
MIDYLGLKAHFLISITGMLFTSQNSLRKRIGGFLFNKKDTSFPMDTTFVFFGISTLNLLAALGFARNNENTNALI